MDRQVRPSTGAKTGPHGMSLRDIRSGATFDLAKTRKGPDPTPSAHGEGPFFLSGANSLRSLPRFARSAKTRKGPPRQPASRRWPNSTYSDLPVVKARWTLRSYLQLGISTAPFLVIQLCANDIANGPHGTRGRNQQVESSERLGNPIRPDQVGLVGWAIIYDTRLRA